MTKTAVRRTRADRAKANRKWLDDNGYTIEGFANACNPPVHFSTAMKWTQGARPREIFRQKYGPQFKGCPIFS